MIASRSLENHRFPKVCWLVVLILVMFLASLQLRAATSSVEAHVHVLNNDVDQGLIDERIAAATSTLRGLTLFFSPDQRNESVDTKQANTTDIKKKTLSTDQDKNISLESPGLSSLEVDVEASDSRAGIHILGIQYSARLKSGTDVRVIVNNLPCQNNDLSTPNEFSCAGVSHGRKIAMPLICPHLLEAAYRFCLEDDLQTLAVLVSGKVAHRLQVGDAR